MPKHEDPPQLACHGCALVMAVDDDGYCPACAERRAYDPVITVQGRTMHLSELRMQAEDDKDLAAALDGDTIREQIAAAKEER